MTTLQAADIATVLKSLPHRNHFLLIERIVDNRTDKSAVGIKKVTINGPQFQGHFSSEPVFPGVLTIEGMTQTAGVIVEVGAMLSYR